MRKQDSGFHQELQRKILEMMAFYTPMFICTGANKSKGCRQLKVTFARRVK